VLVNGPGPQETTGDADGLAMSAIVISRDDETRIETAVASVVGQEVPAPFEVIVVTSGTDRTAEIVRTRFPSVRLVELPRPALPGEARNAGLALARGRYVSFPGSHVELPPDSLAARLRAHRLGYAMVTATVLNGTRTRAGWAVYFLNYASMLPGRPSGALAEPPQTCSYLRATLEHVGGFPEAMRAGEDTLVNNELFRMGYGAWRAREVRFVHKTLCSTPGLLVQHALVRGRALARVLLAERRPGRTLLTPRTIRILAGHVPGRFLRIARCVERWADPEVRRRWRRAAPLVLLGVVVSWCAVWYELLRPGSGGLGALCGWGEPPQEPRTARRR
jgi:glycosyltransferase involved in cell wall biosynthesis